MKFNGHYENVINPSLCTLLGCFLKFPVDPYYEPLSWFMITRPCKLFSLHCSG